MKQFLNTAKLGMLVLGMFAVLCVPHIVLAAHGQSHSNHYHAFSNATGYLAEKENEEKKQLTSANKDADSNSHIVIASDESAEIPCPQKTDETDNK